jgi:hypothetical protein
MTIYKLPFQFQSTKTGLSRRRYGWCEIDVEIPDRDPDEFKVATCSMLSQTHCNSVYATSDSFWVSPNLYSVPEIPFNTIGVLAERVRPIDAFARQLDMAFYAERLYPDAPKGRFGSTSRNVGAGNWLQPGEISDADVAFYRELFSRQLVSVEGRILAKAHQPMIGVRLLPSSDLKIPAELIPYASDKTFQLRDPENRYRGAGVSFAWTSDDYVKIIEKARDFDLRFSNFFKNDHTSKVMMSTLKEYGVSGVYDVVQGLAMNLDVIQSVKSQVDVVAADVIAYARDLTEWHYQYLQRSMKSKLVLNGLSGELALPVSQRDQRFVERLAEILERLPRDDMGEIQSWVLDQVLDRWFDRVISPTAMPALSLK